MPGVPAGPDGPSDTPPPPPPPPPFGGPGGAAGPRLLRRSRTDRYGVGVCGGLGTYFGIDPVIFRIVLAVLAVFGGAGIVLYLLLWLAIPEEGAKEATLDRAIGELRRRKIPFGVALVVAIIVIWAFGFSWWTPGSLFPAIIVCAVVIALLARRERRPVEKAAQPPEPEPSDADPRLPWVAEIDTRSAARGSQLREWMAESRDRARRRRRRAFPIWSVTLGVAVLTVAGMAIADALNGIPFAAYFWTGGAILLTGLVIGLVSRRTPWSLFPLLVPIALGLIAFGSSPVSVHDGWGQRSLQPATLTDLNGPYQLAFGEEKLDLSKITSVDSATTVRITLGAGQIQLVIPRSLPVTIRSDVHFGAVTLNGTQTHGGVDFTREISTEAAGSPGIVIDARVATGQVDIIFTG